MASGLPAASRLLRARLYSRATAALVDLLTANGSAVPVSGALWRWPVSSGLPTVLRPFTSLTPAAQPALGPVSLATPSADNFLYRIEVVTGDIRGAGSPSPAKLQLVGSSGRSEAFLMGEEDGFDRSSTKVYMVSVGQDIGELQRVSVEQLGGSMTELGTGWFLERVDVTVPNGERLTFPCHHWIGKSDSGDLDGPASRNLIPCRLLAYPKDFGSGEPIAITASAVAVPHPDKVAGGMRAVNRKHGGYGGEDAYFYAQVRPGLYALGVADGIYSWKAQGIDSGEFSRALLEHARALFAEEVQTDVLTVLQQSERRVKAAGIQGSSTVCLVVVDLERGRLTSANIGDSGFLVLGTSPNERHLHVKYRSPQQEHEFGFPYQLGHQPSADTANDAILITLPIIPGDYILLGSDGLFDNVSDAEVVSIVERLLREGNTSTGELARCLLHNAYHNSLDRSKATPYSLAATEVFDMVYSGGKKDDITVVVAAVGEAAGTQSSSNAPGSRRT